MARFYQMAWKVTLSVSMNGGMYAFSLSIIYCQLILTHSSRSEISVGNADIIGIVVIVSRYRSYNIILCAISTLIPSGEDYPVVDGFM